MRVRLVGSNPTVPTKNVSLRPNKYKISQTKAAKDGRNKFGAASGFASIINANDILANVWAASKLKGKRTYHQILKENLKFISDSFLTEKNIIVPTGSLSLIKEIIWDKNSSRIFLFENPFTTLKADTFNFELVVYLTSPVLNSSSNKSDAKDAVNFISFSKSVASADLNSDISFELTLNSSHQKLISSYQNCTLFSAVVINSNNILKWTSTYSIMLNKNSPDG